MPRPDVENPRSIKYHMKRFLYAHKERIAGKQVLDIPAGKGVTSALVHELGGKPLSYDLFPEDFEVEGLSCKKADLGEGIPLKDASVDWVICQEGIEHLPDQLSLLEEFNRVLKPGGTLLLTTPNYSGLRSRMSYLISESERFRTMLAPNELDSIWGTSPDKSRVYFGHIFLIGVQKLRLLASLSGFKLSQLLKTRNKTSSLFLFPFIYPFILFFSYFAFRRSVQKAVARGISAQSAKELYGEVFRLNISRRVLLDAYIFAEFTKEKELSQVKEEIASRDAAL